MIFKSRWNFIFVLVLTAFCFHIHAADDLSQPPGEGDPNRTLGGCGGVGEPECATDTFDLPPDEINRLTVGSQRGVMPTVDAAHTLAPTARAPATAVAARPASGPRAKSGTPTSAKPSGDPAKDSQSCTELASQADDACNVDPQTTDSGSSFSSFGKSSGMKQSCDNMKKAANQTARANSDASQACSDAYTSCVQMCRSANQSAQAKKCAAYSSKVKKLSSAALDNVSDSDSGGSCSQASSSGGGGMPSMTPPDQNQNQNQQNPLAQQQSSDPYGCLTNPGSAACQNCKLNPNTASCQALANAEQPPQGKAGFQAPTSNSSSDNSNFNVGDTNSNPTNAAFSQYAQNQNNQQQPLGPAQVPNNSGGSIPGQGGSGSQQASLGGPGGGRGPASAPGYTTDISNGFQGGTGFSYGGGAGPTAAGTPWQSASRSIGRGLASVGGKALDLRKYLPGGQKYDPANRMNGGSSRMNPEISPASADLWAKHSTRIQVRCKLGLLRDCQ